MTRDFTDGTFRNELKYVCSETQLFLIEHRIKSMMNMDSHVKGKDGYQIRSLYFDDYNNTCFYENENGTEPREKFRIRIYDKSTKRILLELKRKMHGKTQKLSAPLDEEQCRMLMAGIPLPHSTNYPPVLQQFNLACKTRFMKPKIIVEYNRIPYVYREGNVRVTFDRHITSSSHIANFLEQTISKRPIMPIGQHVLEVKYDAYLPDVIYHTLELDSLKQATFSKYYLCRKYAL